MKLFYQIMFLGVAVALAGCTHKVAVDDIDVTKRIIGPDPASIDARKEVADATCEAQYSGSKQNYLSAIQTVIAANNGAPSGNNVPLDRFRAEVNAAYNTVVARCSLGLSEPRNILDIDASSNTRYRATWMMTWRCVQVDLSIKGHLDRIEGELMSAAGAV